MILQVVVLMVWNQRIEMQAKFDLSRFFGPMESRKCNMCGAMQNSINYVT